MMKDKLWTRSFLAVAGGNFLLFFAFYLLLPVLPMYLIEQFGANKATVGVVLSSYTITALFVRPFAGYMVDTFPRKPLQLICLWSIYSFFRGIFACRNIDPFCRDKGDARSGIRHGNRFEQHCGD